MARGFVTVDKLYLSGQLRLSGNLSKGFEIRYLLSPAKQRHKNARSTPSSRTRFIPAMFFTACVSASRFSDGASSRSTTETAMFPRERLTRSEMFSPNPATRR